MTAPDPALVAALAPVRAALLTAARGDAARVREHADAAADRTLVAAEQQAERIRAEAREQGAADAASVLAVERAQNRRRARALVLAARRDAYESLRAAARRTVPVLRDDPGYPLLRQHMADAVRRLLGPDVELREGTGGGVIGTGGGRRVDYSLAGFADRAVDEVAAGLEEPPP
jgi:hypothetical protein